MYNKSRSLNMERPHPESPGGKGAERARGYGYRLNEGAATWRGLRDGCAGPARGRGGGEGGVSPGHS